MKRSVQKFSLAVTFALLTATACAQGTAFTYQGRLLESDSPAQGSYDFTFGLFDSETAGRRIAGPVTNAATVVSNGLFTVLLDFGAVSSGGKRWLEIGVRPDRGASFTTLSARQELTPAPYAVTAAAVDAGAITTGMLASGAVTTDKIAPGAVQEYQIDDAGRADYQTFLNSALPLGADDPVSFAHLSPVAATNGLPPALSLTINGSAFGTVIAFSGSEGISQPYSYVVQVRSSGPLVNPDNQVGLPGRLAFIRNGRSTSFEGIVTAVALASAERLDFLYTIRIESPLAAMALTTDYRVSQSLTAPDAAVVRYMDTTSGDADLRLAATYEVHENLIQHGETDFAFISRLLEEEGIFYFFDSGSSPPTLILGDSASAYLTAPGLTVAYYGDTATGIPPAAEYARTFRSGPAQSTLKSTVDTYRFQTPAASLLASSDGGAGVGEHYEFGTAVTTLAHTRHLATVRQGRHEVEKALVSGTGTAPDLRAGRRFTFDDRTGAGMEGDYVITSVRHAGFVREIQGGSTLHYANQFQCIPAAVTYRPARIAPRPQALPSTAVVTGPVGETVHVDEYGRLKVQFHWDRQGMKDENSSAWVRVTSPMAGSSHGMIFLPRIGDEVLVSFIHGDPDRPVIIGSLYNGSAAPPYPLPESKMVSGITSSSAPGGGFNEFKMDDTAGNESISINAARDLNISAQRQISINSPLSINGGTVLGRLQAGQVTVGTSSTPATITRITFPRAFTAVPKVIATVSGDPTLNLGESFAATVRSVSTIACQVNIIRLDSSIGWTQSLQLNWIAWE